MFKIDPSHIKALLDSPEGREAILKRLNNEALVSADIESLSSSDYDVLCDAASNVFAEWDLPTVKQYFAQGGDGEEFPINVIGVKGAYAFIAPEFDDAGLFATLEDAESYVDLFSGGEASEE